MMYRKLRIPGAVLLGVLVLLFGWIIYGSVCGQTTWAAQFGTAEDEGVAQVLADGQGNVYVIGVTNGSLYAANAGESDIFVVKYDSQCSVVWSIQFGSDTEDSPFDAALGPDNHLYVCGQTLGGLYGPGLGDAYDSDAFVVKLSSTDGSVLWSEQFGTAEDEQAWAISVDSQGNSYVAGNTDGSLYGENSDDNAFIAKYDSSGSFVWGVYLETEGVDDILAVSEGQIYVVGSTYRDVFPGGIGGGDAYVARLDSDGDVVWGRRFGTELSDEPTVINVSADGFVYVAGSMNGGEVAGSDAAFLAKYAADGNQLWLRQLNTDRTTDAEQFSGLDVASGITFDSQQNVILVGTTGGDLFGDLSGETDAFVAVYSPSGDLVLSHQVGSDQGDGASGVAVAGDGGIVIAGSTSGDMHGTNAGGVDGFLTRLSVAAQPAMTPGEGTYSSTQSVALSSATPGATIRYTTDGSEPTETSTQYTAPVTVDHSLTLKAKAWKTAYIPSYTKTAEYVIE